MQFKVSLKRAWTILILFTGVVPATIIAIWYGQQIYNDELNAALATERHANELVRSQIESEIKHYKTVLRNKSDALSMPLDNAEDPSALKSMNALLKIIVERESAIHEVMIVSKQGHTIAAVDPSMGLLGDRLATAEELQRIDAHWVADTRHKQPEVMIATMGRDYIGSPEMHEGSIAFSIAVPIGVPAKAVLIAQVFASKIVPEIGRDDHGIGTNDSRGYILDRRGSLITDIEGSPYKQGDLMTQFAITRAGLINKEWPVDAAYTGVLNKPVFGTSTSIPSLNWTLVSEVKASSIIDPIRNVLIKIIGVTLFGVFFFVWFVLYLSNKTIRPINQACAAIDHLAKGDYQQHLEPSVIEELNILSKGFNAMTVSREAAEQELLNSQKSLTDSEAKFRGVLESSAHGVLLCNQQGDIVLLNPAILRMTGYREEELLGQQIEILIPAQFTRHHEHRNRYIKSPDSRLMGGGIDLYLRHKSGSETPVDISLSPVEVAGGTMVAAMVQDIAERKSSEEKILHQAHFDNLSGLPNRFLSLDRLAQLIVDAERNDDLVAVLFLDLDDFKKINDSLGHEAGDKLLVEAASRLNDVVRSGDTVGRLGGDEFIILLGNLDTAADARPIAENIINNFRKAFRIDERELMMTISVGIAVFPTDGNNASELLRNADSAMYHSKDLGRNTYTYFTDEMNRDISRRFSLEEQMHGALERGEFEVFYQPQINLTTNKIMGAEALLRWNNPALGQVSPVEFIPIAEQTGLIIAIGQFVLQQALSQTAQWRQEKHKDFRIAVNLSPRQFRDVELIPSIEEAIAKYCVPSHCLEMEITEGVLMSGHSYINDALTALSQLGVNIAMDDFGTGYSSLSYLRNYPFNVLKVDRSFVNDIIVDEADRELTNAAIAMAHALKLKVVAEGIETSEQLAALKEMDCDYGQGYLFSRPVPANEFTELLNK